MTKDWADDLAIDVCSTFFNADRCAAHLRVAYEAGYARAIRELRRIDEVANPSDLADWLEKQPHGREE